GHNTGNSRNGSTSKNIKGDFGEVEVKVPRDRNGDFVPQLIAKCHHRCNKSSKHQFNLTSRLTLFWPIVFLLVSSREQRHDQSR
ncbi:transposase, partial [Endozoicomonas atrinae]|uniref:transposase n=1 Tax=Endozoicomonas atrinae TaxID=1333660 RepID=UPI000AB92105